MKAKYVNASVASVTYENHSASATNIGSIYLHFCRLHVNVPTKAYSITMANMVFCPNSARLFGCVIDSPSPQDKSHYTPLPWPHHGQISFGHSGANGRSGPVNS